MSSDRRRAPISLGPLLILSLAGLQFVAVLIVVSHSYLSSQRVLLDHARRLLSDVATNAADHARSFLDPAADAATLMSRLVQEDPFLRADWATLEKLLFQQLKVTPHLSGIYFGDEAGNFLYVMHTGEEDRYRTKTVTRDGSGRSTSLAFRDGNFGLIEVRADPEDSYDPRARPWYRAAKERRSVIWTDPYVFYTSRSPGITTAAPVLGPGGEVIGVVGVDIEIGLISNFLGTIRGSGASIAFILNRRGEVIAHPSIPVIHYDDDADVLRFSSVTESADPIAQAAFWQLTPEELARLDGPESVSVDWEGERYVAVLVPMAETALPWTIATYAPEADFIGGITASRRENLVLAGIVALGTALAGIAIANIVYRPVRELAERAQALEAGNLDAAGRLRFRELETASEAMLRQSAERMKTELEYGMTFDLATRGMAQIDPETGRFLKVNKRLADMTGHGEAELLAMTAADLSQPGDPEGFAAYDWDADTDQPLARRLRLKRADGSRVWVEVNGILIKDSEGRAVHVVATVDDVSDLVGAEAQVRRLSLEMAHSARLNTMGQMAASLAHELNQPLTAITQNVDAALSTAREEVPPESELFEILHDLGEGAHRAGDIIATLRDFIRRDEVRKEPVDLGRLIRQTARLVQPEAVEHGITLSLRIAPDLPTVAGNRVQIAQVLVNLIRNAIDAIDAGGAREAAIRVMAEALPGELRVTVEDGGAGLAEGVTLFAPFETTKAKGMGLGLTICKGIVEGHGGRLWHETGPGGRTQFRFTLGLGAEGGQRAAE